jgi:signal transduction histidine kinase
MARLELATSGRSLGRVEGLAGLSPSDLAYIVRRTTLSAVSIGTLIAALAATSAALNGVADHGVTFDASDSVVTDVSYTGYGWRAGIRPGQQVVVLTRSDEPGGWRLETVDGRQTFEAVAASADGYLRQTLPLAVASLGLGYLALFFLRTRRRWVLPAASLALLAAWTPLMLAGSPDVSTAVMGASLVLPAASLAIRVPGGALVRGALLVPIVGFVAAWVWARLTGADEYLGLEDARASIALWATIGLVAVRVALPAFAGEALGVMRPRLLDVWIVAGISAIALVLLNALSAPPLTVAVLLLVAVVVLPATRRRFARGIENALLGDVREAAAVQAAEEERSRLARELHDVPLQELVAVIRRLEILPGAEAESEDLRALAGHLRNVATELRPPVLDDLGLPAALDYLAEESTTEALPVVAEVVDDTGFGAGRRPPAEVELAMFRIASEAVLNAVHHSGGSAVQIAAEVAPDRVEVVIADDGAGLEPDAGRQAAKRKRLGLASMRRRAQAIDAELSIDGSTRGTQVRAVWQA